MSIKEISVEIAFQLQSQGDVIVDVREAHEWDNGHVKDAKHFPKSKIDQFSQTYTDKNQPLVIICQRGVRSMAVAELLDASGYQEVYSVAGGFSAWQDANLPCAG
jgi:rhodanese-related sulfurtransferase